MNKPSSSDLYQAWYNFVYQGIIDHSVVRPVVARSWDRSRHINPWSNDIPRVSRADFEYRTLANSELLKAARPVLQLLFTIMDVHHLLDLTDRDGCILQTLSSFGYVARGRLGILMNEKTLGTQPLGVALIEGTAEQMMGFEAIKVWMHSYQAAGAPVFTPNGDLIGALLIHSPSGVLQDNTEKILAAASLSIQRRLSRDEASYNFVAHNQNLDEATDYLNYYTIIFDQYGHIVHANQSLLELLGVASRESIRGNDINHYFTSTNGKVFNINSNTNEFNVKQDKLFIPCREKNWTIIKGLDEFDYTVLVFDRSNRPDKAAKPASLMIDHIPKPSLDLNFDLIGNSPAWNQVLNKVKLAAPVPATVLLEGESGTGKELIARAIHSISKRRRDFIAINCGAIPRELINSELFGYEEGAFTGARKTGAVGKFELADGGTLFLDEIGEMPLDMQVSLLRFLEDRTVVRLGSSRSRIVDVRIIAATNRNLMQLVEAGEFRKDLYYRLNIVNIKLPPVRERKEDLPILIRYFVQSIGKKYNKQLDNIEDEAMEMLCKYDWPGNVREIRNVIETALVFSQDALTIKALPDYIINVSDHEVPTINRLQKLEKDTIIYTLEKNAGNIKKTAQELGIARNTLYKKINDLHIDLKKPLTKRRKV